MPEPDTSRDARATVTAHYARHDDLLARIEAALPQAGGDGRQASYAALHHLDQFHVGGPAATRLLADMAQVRDRRLLDIGCGIGGPARMLAAEFGCDVTGVDLTRAYCAVAQELSRRVGLAGRTRFVCASATTLPFAAASWDLVWTQHASMNIPDKAGLYAEVARVLRAGGRFVQHDIVAGPGGEPYFPVPWAGGGEGSFLLPAAGMRAALVDAGLAEVTWQDKTPDALAAIRKARAAGPAAAEAPGPHLVMGPEFDEMRRNLARSLEEGRVAVVRAIWRKPGRGRPTAGAAQAS